MVARKKTATEPATDEAAVVVAEPATEKVVVASAPATDEVVVEKVPAADEVVVATVPAADANSAETARLDAATDATPPPPPEIIVVDAPVAPRKRGNRGLGVALALAATVVFTALLVVAGFALTQSFDSIADPEFYFPSLVFFVGLVIVTLVLNRAGWWSHIIGSVVVGVITWFGSATLALLAAGMFSMNQGEANETFWAALFSPILIIAALLAREVAIWTGAILARRGRSLKVRNAEAYEAYEREQAELTPTATA